MAVLEITDANIGYRQPLIKKVSATLKTGEVCLLIGNNGVGKSTLLKSILHQIPLLDGTIKLEGTSIQKLSNQKIAEHIAVVFSAAELPRNYTTTDLVKLGKYIRYPYYFQLNDQDLKEVNRVMKELQLLPYHDFFLDQLSDGNLQKAFIARAFVQNSPFIILDEPTTHLDEENKIIILKLLRKMATEHGRTILFSSHDWRLAKEFSDKIWYIKNQKLHSGVTEDILLQNPELLHPALFRVNDAFVAPIISAPPAETEMLYSFLQKNYNQNLSGLIFTFDGHYWHLQEHDFCHTAANFEELAIILNNSL